MDEKVRFCRSDGAILVALEDIQTEILTKPRGPSINPGNNVETTSLSESSKLRVKTTGDLKPETRYAKSGDINIAYQVL